MRLPRLVLPNQPHHIVQRGNNHQPVFLDQDDYRHFHDWLRAAARQFKVGIHAYVLMPSSVQLLASPTDEMGLARMMQWIGRQYVPYFNAKYGHSGTLWQGRFKTSVIDPDHYLLACSRYIETEPVRAGLAGEAGDYAWSSYAHHVGLRPDPLVVDHPVYWGLGNTPFQREAAYTELIQRPLTKAELLTIENTVLKGWPLGSDDFKRQLEQRAKRQVLPARRGRPPRKPEGPCA